VAPVRAKVPYPGADLATVRFALAGVPYARPLDVTRSLLARSQDILDRWRDRIDQWSRHPSRPVPTTLRTAVIAALDDDLDVAAAVAMMSKLDNAEGVEPGAKFEAFTYLDRVLAVDLARDLGRMRR
jgi:cysteinyl-tRNA synthetase